MGLPAQELYFSEEEINSANNSSVKPTTPTFIEHAPEPQTKDKIKIIGIGGGGRNALNHIIASGLNEVDFLAVDTDVRNLEMSQSPNKVILGKTGTGAGCIPKNGEDAARESLGEIIDFMRGADMVYLTAGMGGGTGTGVIPVIANAARNMGILTVAVVTKPFAFEGPRKMRMAQEGIDKLSEEVDALMVIPNEKLLGICEKDAGIQEAFAKADEVLCQAVVGVTDLITKAGMVNMDFADIKTVLQNSGLAVMGTGRAWGDNRVEEALKQAMESPLMETNPANVRGALMNITSNGSLTLFELQQAAETVQEYVGDEATFIWGSVEDPEIGDEVKITVIASGIDPVAAAERREAIRREERKKQAPEMKEEPAFMNVTVPKYVPQTDSGESFIPIWMRKEKSSEHPSEKVKTEEALVAENENIEESLFDKETETIYDEPTFIRKKTAPKLQ